MSDPRQTIDGFVAARRDEAVGFLAALVRTPSDNPPGEHAAEPDKGEDLHAATEVVALSLYDLLADQSPHRLVNRSTSAS